MSFKKCASFINKVPNFYSYDKTYKKDNKLSEFVMEKFYKKANKYCSDEDAMLYSNHIISCYNDPILASTYETYLHEAEPFIQDTLRLLFEKYPDYSKRILFEFMSGNIKFYNDECSSSYLVSNDGLFELDNHNCEYVNHMYDKFVNSVKFGRLQNVPRKTITKKNILSKDIQLIADNFSIADFTFKI